MIPPWYRSYWSQFPEKEKLLRETVDWDAWLNGEGLELPVKVRFPHPPSHPFPLC